MKKKLLFVINTMGRAGAEMALIELMRRLQLTGQYDISLFAIIPQGELFDMVPEGVKIENHGYSSASVLSAAGRRGITACTAKAFFRRMTGFRLGGYFLRNLLAQRRSGRFQPDKLLWRLLSDGAPRLDETYDLAVAYLEGAATYYVADHVKARHKAAFVHIDYQKAGYTPEMDLGCYDRMDLIFTVSNEVGNQFRKTYPQYADKVRLFRNMLNQDMIRQKAETGDGFDDDYQGIRLVTVGRLHYQKAYDIAIKALRILLDDGYDVRWYVLGEGSERPALEKQIEETGVQGRFVLLGAKSNPYPYVKQADIYVHATRFEGKSIAIEEAQILGKVIVASNCTGNTEQIIPEYDGVLLELNEQNLAHELERVINDKELRTRLAEHVLEKKLDHQEDLEAMLALLDDGRNEE